MADKIAKVTQFAQFTFILLFVAMIIAQYFMEGVIKKDIPIEIIFFIGGIAAGIRDLPALLSSNKKERKKD